MPSPPASPPCALYLVTPPLTAANARAIAEAFASVLNAAPVASALVRIAPIAAHDAKAIVAPFLRASAKAECTILIEHPRLAARLGADGAHVAGGGEALNEALASLKPERIVGAGALRSRDDAMSAGEKGADYVMFGEPFGSNPPIAFDALLARVSWWAEIFETPCVAYAESLEDAEELARAGADFVAVEGAIFDAASPAEAAARIRRAANARRAAPLAAARGWKAAGPHLRRLSARQFPHRAAGGPAPHRGEPEGRGGDHPCRRHLPRRRGGRTQRSRGGAMVSHRKQPWRPAGGVRTRRLIVARGRRPRQGSRRGQARVRARGGEEPSRRALQSRRDGARRGEAGLRQGGAIFPARG